MRISREKTIVTKIHNSIGTNKRLTNEFSIKLIEYNTKIEIAHIPIHHLHFRTFLILEKLQKKSKSIYISTIQLTRSINLSV